MNAYSNSNDTIKFRKVEVDPRHWFVVSGVDHSLLKRKTEGEEPSIPEPLLEVLWTRIQFLRTTHSDLPFEVGMAGRFEAQLPKNYTLQLAQRITNADMFLASNDTVDKALLEKSEYAKEIYKLTRKEEQALMQRYPKASVAHLSEA
jgi:hypothetical protein